MARMRWEGENLEKLKILNYYTQDRKAFAEKGKELFPHLTAPQLKVAVDNARRRGVIPRYSQIADEVIKRTPQEEEEEDYEYQTKADRKIVKLQDELRRVRKLYKEQTKHASGNEALIGAIHEVVPSMKPVTVPERVPLEEGIEEEELVLLLSDLHFGEVVDEDETEESRSTTSTSPSAGLSTPSGRPSLSPRRSRRAFTTESSTSSCSATW